MVILAVAIQEKEMKMAGIYDHKFYDKDIEGVLATGHTVELQFPEDIGAIILNADDVKALAIHLGVIEG